MCSTFFEERGSKLLVRLSSLCRLLSDVVSGSYAGTSGLLLSRFDFRLMEFFPSSDSMRGESGGFEWK